MVGTLFTTDEDVNDSHTYVLSGADADLFEIIEGQLKLKDGLAANFESKDIYTITITSTDSTGSSVSESFNITIVDTNDAPTGVNLSSLRVEHDKDGYVVGNLSTTDEDADDSYT